MRGRRLTCSSERWRNLVKASQVRGRGVSSVPAGNGLIAVGQSDDGNLSSSRHARQVESREWGAGRASARQSRRRTGGQGCNRTGSQSCGSSLRLRGFARALVRAGESEGKGDFSLACFHLFFFFCLPLFALFSSPSVCIVSPRFFVASLTSRSLASEQFEGSVRGR